MLTSAMIFCLSAGLAAAQPGAAPGLDAFGDPLPPGAVTRIGTIRFQHNDRVHAIAYSPDGKRITTAARNAFAVWDADTGKRLSYVSFPPQQVHPGVSSDGALVAHGCEKNAVCVREANGGKVHFTLHTHKDGSHGLAISNDGRRLVSVERETYREPGTIVVWDLESGKALVRMKPKEGPAGGFGVRGQYHLAISPDGQMLASFCYGNQMNVWELKTGKLLQEIAVKFFPSPSGSTFAPDGKHLLWGQGEVLIFLDLAKGTVGQGLPFRVNSNPDHLALSPDGKSLALAGRDHMVHLWDLATGKEMFPAGKERITSARFLPDGTTLLAWSGNRPVRLDFQGKLLGEAFYPAGSWWPSDFSPDGKTVAVAEKKGSVRLYDEASGKELLTLENLPTWIKSLNFSPDGNFLMTQSTAKTPSGHVTNDMILKIWKRTSKTTLKETFQLKLHIMETAFWGGEGRWIGVYAPIYSKGWDFYSLETGRRFRSIPDLRGSVRAVSPSGRVLVDFPNLLELAASKPIRKLQVIRGNSSGSPFVFSHDGRTIAAGGPGTILLWDVSSGEQIAKLEGHEGWIRSLEFSPDGRYLLSAGADTTILLWDCEKLIHRAPPRNDFTEDILKTLWDDLAANDPELGYQAVSLLVSAPAQAVPLLRKKMKPTTAADQRVIQSLIDDLDKENYQVRSRAVAELAKIGEPAEPLLEQTLTRPVSLECQRRVKALLDKMPFEPAPPAWLRTLRALEALELIGTPDAQTLVEDLSKGFAAARQTQEARLTLERMKKRGK